MSERVIKLSVDVNVNLDFSESTKSFLSTLLRPIPACTRGSIEEQKSVEEQKLKSSDTPMRQIAVDNFDPSQESFEQKPVEEQKPAEEQKPVEGQKPAASIDIELLRKELALKVNEHRPAIKTKLTELGAPSITKLDTAKYQEMYNFLKAL